MMTRHGIRLLGLVALACLATAQLATSSAFARSKKKSKTEEANAYCRGFPPTPARAKDRWVKIWYDGTGWRIAWKSEKARRSNRYDIKGLVKVSGDGELSDISVGGQADSVDKLEQSKTAFEFEANLGWAVRGLGFKSTAEKITFNFLIDGQRNASQVLIGQEATSPKKMPFTLKKPEVPANAKGGQRGRRRGRRRW